MFGWLAGRAINNCMSLLIKPPSWGACTTNLTSPSTTPGTSVTAGASNTDGSVVSLLSSITHDVEYMVVGFRNFFTSGANGSTLLDLLIDPLGGSSWGTWIDDLMVGETINSAGGVPIPLWYHFPIWLPAGCSIGAQARCARTSTITGGVVIYVYGNNANPGSWWAGSRIDTIGVNSAASQGTNHTPGNSSSYSSWADFGSVLAAPCGALQFAVHGTNTDTNQAAASYLFEFGAAGIRIGPNIHKTTQTTESGYSNPTGPIFCSLAQGTQLQVRAACSGSAETIDVAAYAVY